MATGRVATTQLTSGAIGTYTTVYTVPTGYYGVYNISITNTAAAPVTIRLALGATTSPGTSEFIEYGTTIIANGVFERTSIVAQAGLNILVSTTGTAVNVNVYGIETSTS